MATAGSRSRPRNNHRRSDQAVDGGDPQVVGTGDDGQLALQHDDFWPLDEQPAGFARVPAASKLRRKLGRSPRRAGPAPQSAGQATENRLLHAGPVVRESFELHTTGNPALADYELMEALAGAAARVNDDAQAARLVAAIVPLALRLPPDVSGALWPVLPELLEGVARMAEQLRRRPANRPLLRLLPMLLRRTSAELRQQIHAEQELTGAAATLALTQQATIVFHLRRDPSTPTADPTSTTDVPTSATV